MDSSLRFLKSIAFGTPNVFDTPLGKIKFIDCFADGSDLNISARDKVFRLLSKVTLGNAYLLTHEMGHAASFRFFRGGKSCIFIHPDSGATMYGGHPSPVIPIAAGGPFAGLAFGMSSACFGRKVGRHLPAFGLWFRVVGASAILRECKYGWKSSIGSWKAGCVHHGESFGDFGDIMAHNTLGYAVVFSLFNAFCVIGLRRL